MEQNQDRTRIPLHNYDARDDRVSDARMVDPDRNHLTLSHNLTFLPFIAAGSLAFVGATPAFKDCDIEYQVHMTAAYFAAAFSMIW